MVHTQDINSTVPLARLDGTGLKILCGYRLPNGKLCDGLIAVIKVRQFEGSQDAARFAEFPSGWTQTEGVWGEARQSRRRRMKGWSSGYSRTPGGGAPGSWRTPDRYPALARCPVGEFHICKLDALALDVKAWPAWLREMVAALVSDPEVADMLRSANRSLLPTIYV
jgi:hypothetical protein